MVVNFILNVVQTGIDSAAHTSTGRKLLNYGDKLLTVIDDCLQWSLPPPAKGEAFNPEPNRPLPWFFFLMAILTLRVIRFGINICTFLIGANHLGPSELIHILRTVRRRVAVARIKAQEANQKLLQKELSNEETNDELKRATRGLKESLRLLLLQANCKAQKRNGSPTPTEICISSEFYKESLKNKNDSGSVSKESKKKRKSKEIENNDLVEVKGVKMPAVNEKELKLVYDEEELKMVNDEEELVIVDDEMDENENENDESLMNKINRLANEPSDEDPDYEPESMDESSDDEDDEGEPHNSSQASISEDEINYLKKDDNELDSDFLEPRKAKLSSQLIESQKFLLEENGQLDELCLRPTNGIGDEHEDAYYSPVSWKSVSPEISMPYDKHVDFIENEKKMSELTNGTGNNDKVEKDDDSRSSSIGSEAVGDVGNGHLKDKRQTTSHSGKQHHHHHHQKNKRSNHTGRKKK